MIHLASETIANEEGAEHLAGRIPCTNEPLAREEGVRGGDAESGVMTPQWRGTVDVSGTRGSRTLIPRGKSPVLGRLS